MKMVYSDSLNEMVQAGFTLVKVRFYKDGRPYKVTKIHFTWNDYDCVYWCDDTDDWFYFEPKAGIQHKPSWLQRALNGYTTAEYFKAD